MRVGGALLAAGASSRFGGRPKALLELGGTSFLRRLATELAAVAEPTLVVAPPAHAARFAAEILGTGARLVLNRRPERGMGSSLATAVRALAHQAPELDALLVALVDQPLADRGLFQRLVAAASASGRGVAACDYGDGVVGPPALFPRPAFAELGELGGDHGARDLLQRLGPHLARVDFPGGRLDVDVRADYQRLLEVDSSGAASAPPSEAP